MVANPKQTTSARLATLDQLMQTLISAHLDPVPSAETLREWFDTARIPRFKANPAAKRGGRQKSRGQHGCGTRQAAEEMMIGMFLEQLRDHEAIFTGGSGEPWRALLPTGGITVETVSAARGAPATRLSVRASGGTPEARCGARPVSSGLASFRPSERNDSAPPSLAVAAVKWSGRKAGESGPAAGGSGPILGARHAAQVAAR